MSCLYIAAVSLPAGLTGALTVAIGAPLTRAVVGAAVPLEPLIDSRFSQYIWSYGDGVTETNAYAAPGAYPVILTAYNNSGAAAARMTTPDMAWLTGCIERERRHQ